MLVFIINIQSLSTLKTFRLRPNDEYEYDDQIFSFLRPCRPIFRWAKILEKMFKSKVINTYYLSIVYCSGFCLQPQGVKCMPSWVSQSKSFYFLSFSFVLLAVCFGSMSFWWSPIQLYWIHFSVDWQTEFFCRCLSSFCCYHQELHNQ